MKKLICVDIDGTILPFHGEINPKVYEVFKDTDDKYIIATGRPLFQVREFGLNIDCVCSNGAEVIKDGELIQLLTIETDTVVEIVDLLMGAVGNVSISTTVGLYFHEQVNLEKMTYDMVMAFDGHFSQERYDRLYSHFSDIAGRFSDVGEFIKENKLQVTKIEATTLDVTKELIEKINNRDDVNSFSSVGGHIEVVAMGVNKAEGIKKYIGDQQFQVFAVGDGDNDIEMFEYADVGYAMGNCTSGLEEVATHKTLTAEKDGFLYAIEHIKENY